METQFFQAVRRCRYCKSDMTDTVSADSYLENPYCHHCLHERLRRASESLGRMQWITTGSMISVIPKTETVAEGT